MTNYIKALFVLVCGLSSVILSEEKLKVSFIVEYETKELKAEVQQSVYDLHIENIHSNEKPTELSVFDDKVAETQLPYGEYRYTLHTRLPHFRQSGSFKVDGDVLVTITHAVPKVLNRKLVFRDQLRMHLTPPTPTRCGP
jgi:hypothetical protein